MLVELYLLWLFSLPTGFCYQCGLTREVSFFYEHHVDHGDALVVPCEPPVKEIGHLDRGERFTSVQWLDQKGCPVSPSVLTRDAEMIMKPAEGAMSGNYCCLANYESAENVLKQELYVHRVTVYSRMPPNSSRCSDGFETKNKKCAPCLPGHYGTGGLLCTPCPPNTYSDFHFSTFCLKCSLWKETVHERATLNDCHYPITAQLVVFLALLLVFTIAVFLCLWFCFFFRRKGQRKVLRNRKTSTKNFEDTDVEKAQLLKGGSESEDDDRTETEQTTRTELGALESPGPRGIEWSSYRVPSKRSFWEEEQSRPTLSEGSITGSPSANSESENGSESRKNVMDHQKVPVGIFNMGDNFSFFSSSSSGPDLSVSPSEKFIGGIGGVENRSRVLSSTPNKVTFGNFEDQWKATENRDRSRMETGKETLQTTPKMTGKKTHQEESSERSSATGDDVLPLQVARTLDDKFKDDRTRVQLDQRLNRLRSESDTFSYTAGLPRLLGRVQDLDDSSAYPQNSSLDGNPFSIGDDEETVSRSESSVSQNNRLKEHNFLFTKRQQAFS